MARKTTVEIILKAKDLSSKVVGKAKKSFEGLGKTIAVGLTASIGVAIAAFVKLDRFITAATTAAGIQEDAVAGLRAQLSALGPEADKVTEALAKQAAALQLTTRFGDELTIAAQSQLAVFTQNEEQLKALTIVTQDFATAQGIDLIGAAQLLAKTFGSTTNALSRYGITVEGAAGSNERLISLVENLTALFGGRATAAADTYSGAMVRLANAQGDATEAFGEAITKSDAVNRAINRRIVNTNLLADSLREENATSEFLALILEKLKNTYLESQIGISELITSFKTWTTIEDRLLSRLDANNEGLIFRAEQLRNVGKETIRTTLTQEEFTEAILENAEAMDFNVESNRLLTEAENLAREEKEAGILATQQQEESIEEATEAIDENTEALIRNIQTQQQAAAQADITALAFDRLSASQGRDVAVSEALQRGGRRVQGGRVLELPGGGSRLINAPEPFGFRSS